MASQELHVAACVDDVLGQWKEPLLLLLLRHRLIYLLGKGNNPFAVTAPPTSLPPPPLSLPVSPSDLPSSIFLGNLPGLTLGAFVLDTRRLSQIVAGLVARLVLPSHLFFLPLFH